LLHGPGSAILEEISGKLEPANDALEHAGRNRFRSPAKRDRTGTLSAFDIRMADDLVDWSVTIMKGNDIPLKPVLRILDISSFARFL
jgi:hypothetical protein